MVLARLQTNDGNSCGSTGRNKTWGMGDVTRNPGRIAMLVASDFKIVGFYAVDRRRNFHRPPLLYSIKITFAARQRV